MNVSFDIFGDLNKVNNVADDTSIRMVMNQYFCDLSNGFNHLPTTAPISSNQTKQQPRSLIGLLSIEILLDCVFAKEINENKNQIRLGSECEFKNFDTYNSGDLFNNFISVNANEIFYDNEYEYAVLLSINRSDTPHVAIIVDGISDEIPEINILEGKFGVYLCDSGIINKAYSGMVTGM